MSKKTNIDEIILRVAEIIIHELKLEDVTPEKFDPEIDLVDEVGIDSMDLATVALVLQDEYAIQDRRGRLSETYEYPADRGKHHAEAERQIRDQSRLVSCARRLFHELPPIEVRNPVRVIVRNVARDLA